MRYSLFIMLGLTFVVTANANAAIYKGHIFYTEDCRSCHQQGDEISASRTQSQWESVMQDHGKALAKTHLSSKNAIDSWDYFKSAKYERESRHLKDFLVEYAKDSGNVLACE